MRRREFITLVGGAAALPLAAQAQAQQQPMPVIGFLSGTSPNSNLTLQPFLQGLMETGFVGQNVAIEYRWADGRNDRLAAMAADLVNLKVLSSAPWAERSRLPAA